MIHSRKQPNWLSLLLLAALAIFIPATTHAQTWADPATETWNSAAVETWIPPLAEAWLNPALCVWTTVAQHSAALSWMASATPGVTYNVYRSTSSGGPYVRLASSVNSTNWTDAPLSSGTTLYFVVTAWDGTNESVYSNEVQAIIP